MVLFLNNLTSYNETNSSVTSCPHEPSVVRVTSGIRFCFRKSSIRRSKSKIFATGLLSLATWSKYSLTNSFNGQLWPLFLTGSGQNGLEGWHTIHIWNRLGEAVLMMYNNDVFICKLLFLWIQPKIRDLKPALAAMPQLAATNGFQIRIQRKKCFLHHVSDRPYLSLQSVFGKILEILESKIFFRFFHSKD